MGGYYFLHSECRPVSSKICLYLQVGYSSESSIHPHPNLRILKASGHYSLFFIRRPSLLSLLKLIPGSQKYIVQRRRIVFGDVRRGDSATIVDQFFSLYLSKWVWNSNRCCREIMNSKRLQVKSTSHPSTLSMTNLDLKESTTQWSL